MMFTLPATEPEVAIEAAAHAQNEFLRIVGGVVGPEHAHLYGAMLLTSVHGIASMSGSGHLSPQMWQTTPQDLTEALISLVTERR